ncbi:hypothetical protein [Dietzia psychralcaliphila]|uniref:hypothetical protein n=1 Tax=Dietzia psychralcaliphila TaxID=139021 RepID=UPI001330B51F|nr:hypothetical protein [Dietzia psychralcaliphila]
MSVGNRPVPADPGPRDLDRMLAECPDLSAATAHALLDGRELDVAAAPTSSGGGAER